MNQKQFKNFIKSLTPRKAWECYADLEVERFLSEFHAEGITDIKAMCIRFAQDIPAGEGRPICQKDLDYLAKLFEQYIHEYVESKGGCDKLTFYTEEELDEMFNNECKALFEAINDYARRKGCKERLYFNSVKKGEK